MTKHIHIALLFILATVSFNASSQEICMVTADFETGNDYVVIWEPIQDISNIDSIFIYRKQGAELQFSHVGSVAVTASSSSYFVDTTATTYEITQYSIVYIYSDSTYSNLSPWHQAVVMDYAGNGDIVWTKYKKENQVDETYIDGYEVLKDNLGIGNFLGLGSLLNSILGFTDLLFILTPQANYVVEVTLPTCNVQEKADINTSRSNIKQQIANPATSTDTTSTNPYPPVFEQGEGNTTSLNYLKGVEYQIQPNPANNELTILLPETTTIDQLWINDINGKKRIQYSTESSSMTISTVDLSNGIYFINVETNGIVTSKRFVIAH